MLYQIVIHTPHWVWAVLLALLWMGLSQAVPRRASLRRVILLPLVMTGFSLYGTFSAFGGMTMGWILWLGAALATGTWFASGEVAAGVRYDAQERLFHLPGSWAPLGLMMAIFATRYVVGATLGVHPEWAHDVEVAAIVASIYGALTGVFAGRMLLMLRLARKGQQPHDEGTSVAWG